MDYPSLGGGCNILGNPDLEHETSVNKEIGINYAPDNGLNAGITYFHNDYKDKIVTGNYAPELVLEGTEDGDLVQVFRWTNTPKAIVEGLEGSLTVPVADNLEWVTNATVMLESKDKTTGQPLSIVPDYTINTLLSWQVNEDWELVASAQHYGETDSPTLSTNSGAVIENPKPREAYTIVNLNSVFTYQNIDLTLSVKNVLDKEIYREGTQTNAGANTYNEPGRSWLLSATYHF